jgi:hypothetical protein
MKHKPPQPSRLSHYKSPLRMAGDPLWGNASKSTWENRTRAVYDAMIREKRARESLPPKDDGDE